VYLFFFSTIHFYVVKLKLLKVIIGSLVFINFDFKISPIKRDNLNLQKSQSNNNGMEGIVFFKKRQTNKKL
jgi:hypothetical protein